MLQAVARTFALEPSGHFQQLVRELAEQRKPGEPVYVFVRSLPAWIYYSTNWDSPDTTRLAVPHPRSGRRRSGIRERAKSGPRGRRMLRQGSSHSDGPSVELIGLPSGMEWREVEEHVSTQPDSGWVEAEARRIEQAATPGIWVLASTYYAAERRLFQKLEQDASRRTFAHLRNGSALVRYEFPDSLGRDSTSARAGR